MPDVREILNEGADINPGLPDVAELVRRGQVARRRRAVAVAGGLAGATAVVALVAAVLVRFVLAPPPDLSPAPAPTTPLPSSAGPIEPGRYDASPAGVDVSFEIPGSGWTLATVGEGWTSLRHGRSTVALQHWDEVVDPAADPVGPTDTSPVPDDLVAWLTSHPRLDVAGVDRAQVGEETWTAVEVSVEEPLSTTPAECNTLPCVLLAVTGEEPTELLARDRARVLVAEAATTAPAEPPAVVVVTGPRGQSTPDPAVEALLASISTA